MPRAASVRVALASRCCRYFLRSIAAKGVMLTAVYGSMSTVVDTLRTVARDEDLAHPDHQVVVWDALLVRIARLNGSIIAVVLLLE